MKNRDYIFPSFFFIFFLFPIAILGIDFFDFKIIKKLFEVKTFNILINTTIQSSISVFVSLFIGIPIAIYLSKNQNILTKITDSTIFIPFFFPSVATGIAISQLLRGTNLSYSLFSIVLAHVFYNSPIIIKYLSESLRNIDNDLVESAKIDGAGRVRIFFSVIIFQIKDGLLRGVFLAFVYCFTSFAVILSVGNIAYSTFETAIYTSMFAKFDIGEAFFYALFQFTILSLINILFFKKEIIEIPKKYDNFVNKRMKFSFIIFLIIFYIIFEYGIILNSFYNSLFNTISKSFDLTYFVKLFSIEFNSSFPIIVSIMNSLILSFVVSCISIFISIFALEKRGKLTDFAILLSFGISTTFIALMLYYLHIKFNIDLIILTIIGLSLISIPIAYSFMYDNYKNFDRNLVDLATLDSCNNLKTFIFIKFPIMKYTIISTFFQVFTIIYGEFTLVFSMKIQKIFPLASLTNYLISGKRLMMETNAFNILNILVIILIFLISLRFKEKD
ncbi:MAG TPA: ABC transporter permease subunit [Spirochaetota bacterium]|nr:ABC transporter permease subunit [Spirochaetota bacterium]